MMRVLKVSDVSLTSTHKAYVHADVNSQNLPYVAISRKRFDQEYDVLFLLVDKLPTLDKNTIALNVYHLEYLGNPIEVEVKFTNEPEVLFSVCMDIHLEVRLADSYKGSVEVEKKDLVSFLYDSLEQNIVFSTQQLGIFFKDHPFIVQVHGMRSKQFLASKAIFRKGITVINLTKSIRSPQLQFLEKKNKKALLPDKINLSELGIGGLDFHIQQIIRRVLSTRILPSDKAKQLGIQPVKGILLHGPPGTGKTLVARQMSKILQAASVHVVNGPELMNKYLGASEQNLRELFADAIKDWKVYKEESDLHVFVFDEIDSFLRKRTGDSDPKNSVGDSMVNQFLTLLDGLDSPGNILVFGLTNRKDLIDEAVLRPGRLELHLEVGLPDSQGRKQILEIHTKSLTQHDLISSDVDLDVISKRALNFSGAELEGVVKNAVATAMSEGWDVFKAPLATTENLKFQVKQEHLLKALEQQISNSSQGWSLKELSLVLQELPSLPNSLNQTLEELFTQAEENELTWSCLLSNANANTALAVAVKITTQTKKYSLIRLLNPEFFLHCSGNPEMKVKKFLEVLDALKTTESFLLVLENLECLLDCSGPGLLKLNQGLVQALSVFLGSRHRKRIAVIATTSSVELLRSISLDSIFAKVVEL